MPTSLLICEPTAERIAVTAPTLSKALHTSQLDATGRRLLEVVERGKQAFIKAQGK